MPPIPDPKIHDPRLASRRAAAKQARRLMKAQGKPTPTVADAPTLTTKQRRALASSLAKRRTTPDLDTAALQALRLRRENLTKAAAATREARPATSARYMTEAVGIAKRCATIGTLADKRAYVRLLEKVSA